MKNLIYKFKEACSIACLFLILFSCENTSSRTSSQETTQTGNEQMEAYFYAQLDSSIEALNQMKTLSEVDEIVPFYEKSRARFKLVEPILSFLDKDNYLSLNQPNILKVMEEDATDIKIVQPFGFQVMEELLQEEDFSPLNFQKQVGLVSSRLKLVRSTIKPNSKPYHVLWLIRNQIVRVATLGITGFDSPSGNSLEESKLTYQTIGELFRMYQDDFDDTTLLTLWHNELKATQLALQTDFDSFDRYSFIKNHTHQQLELLLQTSIDWKVEYPFELAIRNNAINLFTYTTFNLNFFNDYHKTNAFSEERAALGEELFNDVNLSKSKQMSCGTCHQKQLAFTDGLTTFANQKRNSPTLKYAALQKSFFYDNRAGSLEGQIVSVVNDKHEFDSDLEAFVITILEDSAYTEKFNKSYDEVNDQNIRNAIANYIRKLSPFTSKFDQNMTGEKNDLTAEEKQGFNLFMGKAQCGTCHFAPTFNGTVPPYFTDSEMELLGVPDNAEGTVVDDDLGRYEIFQTEEKKYFFKTPTVRNAALTAPYMHNGVYQTLEEVMTFYNHGGGVGMGFELPYQTLPSDSLGLSEVEIKSLIAFIGTLTDEK